MQKRFVLNPEVSKEDHRINVSLGGEMAQGHALSFLRGHRITFDTPGSYIELIGQEHRTGL
jgi:hypothetical protein